MIRLGMKGKGDVTSPREGRVLLIEPSDDAAREMAEMEISAAAEMTARAARGVFMRR